MTLVSVIPLRNTVDCSVNNPRLPSWVPCPIPRLWRGKATEGEGGEGVRHLQRLVIRNVLLRLAGGQALPFLEGHEALQAVGVFGDDLAGGDGGDEELWFVAF